MILFLVSFPSRKKGAISGPVAPINTVESPLTTPTGVKDFLLDIFLGCFKNKYHIIKHPIYGFKNSTSIWFADSTLNKLTRYIIISPDKTRPKKAPLENSKRISFFKYSLNI